MLLVYTCIYIYTCKYGTKIYKICCVQGEYDDILTWPFKQKVTLVLMDQLNQSENISESFKPDSMSSSFQKPISRMNVASGCPRFVAHKTLETDSRYLRNDCLFFKLVVDTRDLMF